MTLLNPGVLWGLLALAVPIIVHFFNLQRPRQILFSNVSLVREVKKTVVRRVKFKQWLLLLARLLAITLLVFAFANPVMRQSGQSAASGNRSVALIIDNSLSMQAANEQGAYLNQSLSIARSLIRSYDREDEFLLMTTADLRLNDIFVSQEKALQALQEIQAVQNTRSHQEIIGFRESIFSRAAYPNHELYLLSDFQRSTVMADSQLVSLADSNTQIFYLPLATRGQKNVYIADHKIQSQILQPNKPIEMVMTLVNDGDIPANDLSVRVMIGERVAAISNTSLEPGAQKELSLSFTPTTPGWQSGYIDLDDNPVDFDNKRYFSLYVPDKERVLVVENEVSPYIRLLYDGLFDRFEVNTIKGRDFSSISMGDYRSIVWVGANKASSGQRTQLKQFLEEGGSLLLFPGSSLNIDEINQFYQSLGVGTWDNLARIQEGRLANSVDLAHPVFEGIFTGRGTSKNFDAPRIFQYYPLSLAGGQIQNRILGLSPQSPILVGSQVGNGLLFTFTIFPGDAWSDLPVKTIFTPLLFRLTQIMNQTQKVQSGQKIGQYTPLALQTSAQQLITMENEAGQVFTPEQYDRSGGITLSFDNMELQPGNYAILQGDTLLERLSLNISDQESKLSFLGERPLRQWLSGQGQGQITVLSADRERLITQIEQAKRGTPLWRYFLWAAILFLVVEIGLLFTRQKPS